MVQVKHGIRFLSVSLLLLGLLTIIPYTTPVKNLVMPVHAIPLTGLAVWSPVYHAPAIVNSSITTGALLQYRVNVTGGRNSLNGFNITATWDKTVLNGTSIDYHGGIFDNPNYLQLAKVVKQGQVQLVAILRGTSVPSNGTLVTITVKVIAGGSSNVAIDSSTLLSPGPVPFVPLDGFFSNSPTAGDLILTSLLFPQELIPLNSTVRISAGVRNMGSVPMGGVKIDLVANTTTTPISINSTTIGAMLPNTAQVATIVWNTTGYKLGLYNLNATVTATTPESFLGDNSLALEQVQLVIHDLAVVSLRAQAVAKIGNPVSVNVTLKNQGTVLDIANFSIYANNTLVRRTFDGATSISVALPAGSSDTVSVEWNTTSAIPGNYTLKAVIQPIPGESNVANNILRDGNITLANIFQDDLAVIGSLPSAAFYPQNVTFTLTVANEGINAEDYTLMVSLGSQNIFSHSATNLQRNTNLTLTFNWNTFAYSPGTYSLTAVLTCACNDQYPSNNQLVGSFNLQQNTPPTTSFSITPTVPQPGANVALNAFFSTDQDGDSLTYSWNFGDGTTSATGSIVNHAYTSSGNYSITLTVTDSLGNASPLTKTVRVNAPPVASFTASASSITAGSAITFDASSSSDSDGTVVTYQWNFGDGSNATGKSVTHTFANPGSYQVKLSVTDNDGGTKQFAMTIRVDASVNPILQAAPYIAAGVGIAALAAGALLLIRRRRKQSITGPVLTSPQR